MLILFNTNQIPFILCHTRTERTEVNVDFVGIKNLITNEILDNYIPNLKSIIYYNFPYFRNLTFPLMSLSIVFSRLTTKFV